MNAAYKTSGFITTCVDINSISTFHSYLFYFFSFFLYLNFLFYILSYFLHLRITSSHLLLLCLRVAENAALTSGSALPVDIGVAALLESVTTPENALWVSEARFRVAPSA